MPRAQVHVAIASLRFDLAGVCSPAGTSLLLSDKELSSRFRHDLLFKFFVDNLSEHA
jgi:hypothetical protein